jgi:AbrB family looped-hinge helix DNA binding protein
MSVETLKMSSKGQIVIPYGIREELHAMEGTLFAVLSSKDTVILKKIEKPSKEELIKDLKAIAVSGKKRLQKKGFTEATLRAK